MSCNIPPRTINSLNNVPRSLEYSAVGRNLLMVDQLPPGAYARYERDVRQTAHIPYRNPDDIVSSLTYAEISIQNNAAMRARAEIQAEVERDIFRRMTAIVASSPPLYTVLFNNPPLFDIIGFKPSKDNKFNAPKNNDSPFTIYGVK